MKHRRFAFTLIELLVVIAIITALLSILLPSLRNAVRAGQKAVCAANLHQIQLVMSGYYVDNNRRPAMWLNGTNVYSYSTPTPVLQGWPGGPASLPVEYFSDGSLKAYWANPYFLYANASPEFAFCPETLVMAGDGDRANDFQKSRSGTYVFNGYSGLESSAGGPFYKGQTNHVPQSVSRIQNPAALVIAHDGYEHMMEVAWNDNLVTGGDAYVRLSQTYSAYGPDTVRREYYRHLSDTGNIVFFDGHVGSTRRQGDGVYNSDFTLYSYSGRPEHQSVY